MTIKSLLLTGLLLVGMGCGNQAQAFSFSEWVPACIANLFENPHKKFARLCKEKYELKKQIGNLDHSMKITLLTPDGIQQITQKRAQLATKLQAVNSELYKTAAKLGIVIDEYSVMHCGDSKKIERK